MAEIHSRRHSVKLFAILTVFAFLSSAQALEEFGGVRFHSSVPEDQVSALKTDLTYVFTNPNPNSDAEFLEVTGLPEGSGPQLHNWLYNRVRYIVGIDFDIDRALIRRPKLGFRYPESPLPQALRGNNQMASMQILMANIGSLVYLLGKRSNQLNGLYLDGRFVFIKSTRAGILQMGPGLFSESFQINKSDPKAPANSVARGGILFHEARHSDGNGEGSGFLHDKCPTDHVFAGAHACEAVGNGSYTVGGLAMRHLLKNCATCTTEEKTILAAQIADAFGRVIRPTDSAKLQERARLVQEWVALRQVRDTYRGQEWPESQRAQVEAELEALDKRIDELDERITRFNVSSETPLPLRDAIAEGSFKEEPVSKTERMMRRSLR